MSFRHCRRCGTEVEDVGGYCLLGHPLRLSAPTDSLSSLRAEVNRAFADVEVKVAEVLATAPAGHNASDSGTYPAETTAPAAPTATAEQDPIPRNVSPPPPPPPAPRQVAEFEPSVGPDPITEFAPAPRMDWGPERSGILKRRR